MGSTGTHRDRGMSDKTFFENEFPTALGGEKGNGYIVACASKPAGGEWQRVFYAAVQNHPRAPHDPGKIWCLVVLMHTSRNPNSWFNFTYKTMSDESGPSEDTCPTKILDLLSPTDDKYAVEWRARCRKHAEKMAAAAKVKSGTVLQFAQPIEYPDPYGKVTRARIVKRGRKTTFVALDEKDQSRFACRIPNWQERAYEVVA